MRILALVILASLFAVAPVRAEWVPDGPPSTYVYVENGVWLVYDPSPLGVWVQILHGIALNILNGTTVAPANIVLLNANDYSQQQIQYISNWLAHRTPQNAACSRRRFCRRPRRL